MGKICIPVTQGFVHIDSNQHNTGQNQNHKLLIERGDYEETLRFCEPACQLYPFDEWQSVRIDCYMALNRYKDAVQEYENTAKLFFEELGIRPSEHMMQQFEQMSSRLNYKPQELGDIKERLKEDDIRGGAFYCSLPSFRDSYRLVSRIIETVWYFHRAW